MDLEEPRSRWTRPKMRMTRNRDNSSTTTSSANTDAESPVEVSTQRRRGRDSESAPRGFKSLRQMTSSEINLSVLSIEGSFQRLTQQQQLRLFYLTCAIREAQKLAFLQSSRESPAILLLFQELFSSPDEELHPGELILELQKTCFAKGLAEAVPKFFKYAVLFYHNSGNYDLLTGAKILPELSRLDFQEVVFSSRAFAQRRGLRLQRAMDACLDAIYSSGDQPTSSSPGKPTRADNPRANTEATIVPMHERLSYPFYGPGVTYMDAVRVDRALDQHQVLKINTRIVKVVDTALNAPRATFHVFQASISTEKSGGSEENAQQNAVQTLTMSNQDQIKLYRQDYGPFLKTMTAFLNLASRIGDTEKAQLHEETVALLSAPCRTCWSNLHHAWLVNGHPSNTPDGSRVDFLLRYASLPLHRDPLGTRGALEGCAVVQNDFYQQRMDHILRDPGVVEATFLRVLPFYQLMGECRLKLDTLTVSCVDLVVTSRSAGLLPIVSSLDVKEKLPEEKEKLLFITNCANNYTEGLLTSEKQYLLDGLFSTENAEIVHAEWDRVVFLRFVVEEVLAPRTRVALTAEDKDKPTTFGGRAVALLPAELFVESSDEEEIVFEEESDCDEDSDQGRVCELLEASMRETLLLQSSYAKRPTQWYTGEAGDTYLTKFHERLATVLEECRVVLTGLLLALDRSVREKVCDDWHPTYSEDDDPPKQGPQDEPEDAALNDVGLAYVLLILRDGLLALPFFATQQFRWEDDKMLARHMVLQMLLQGRPEVAEAAEEARSSPIVSVQAIVQKIHRNITQIALGVDEVHVESLKVRVHTDYTSAQNCRPRSWRHQLKIQVRDWLQQIQWIQMTGDVASGQQLYERFSLVSEESLRYRQFLLLQLGDPDATRKAAEAAEGGARRASTETPITTGGAASQEPLPKTPTPSMEVRNKLLGIRNPSHFSRETIWIPPMLELSELGHPPANNVRSSERQTSSSGHAIDGESLAARPRGGDTERGNNDTEKSETHETDTTGEKKAMKRVSLRELPADLSFALEAFVISIGVLTDEDAAVFKIPKA